MIKTNIVVDSELGGNLNRLTFQDVKNGNVFFWAPKGFEDDWSGPCYMVDKLAQKVGQFVCMTSNEKQWLRTDSEVNIRIATSLKIGGLVENK